VESETMWSSTGCAIGQRLVAGTPHVSRLLFKKA